MYLGLSKIKSMWDKHVIERENIIPIIHGTFSFFSDYINSRTHINSGTHIDFISRFRKINSEKDIHIILHTRGGALSSAEAICNCILNYDGTKQIIAYIPYYAYSGGAMIALACNKIVLFKDSVLGPCDAQMMLDKFTQYPASGIIDTINFKKQNKENIKENWLAADHESQLCQKRQKKYINTLIKHRKYSEENCNKIYDEFFSGKYNHDNIFSAQELIDLGINIEVVDTMPNFIEKEIKNLCT